MLNTESEKMAALDEMINSLEIPVGVPDPDIETHSISGWRSEAVPADITDVTDKTELASVPTAPVSTSVLASIPALAELEATEFEEDGRPIIKVRRGYLKDAVRQAETYLALSGRYFQRGGMIVEVHIDPATGETLVHDLKAPGLVYALAGVSAWKQFDKRSKTWESVDPVEKTCNVMVKVGHFDILPVLNGLTRQPYLRPDGSLCQTPGHDPVTGMYGVFSAGEFDVPEAPTREQAEQALALLGDLVSEFAFASPHDRSAALAAMLTAAIRPSLPMAPMFHVRAPQIASGKSYLCALITALATPQLGSPVAFPGRDEEMTKLLLAQLVSSPAVIEFDNLTDDIKPHKSLCSALTGERMKGRILGHSKMMEVGTRTLFLCSGNNVGPAADMTRRCVTIHLDPGCEVPAAREFVRPDLINDVRRDRCKYVAAALTVVRAWIGAGRPHSPGKPLANFGDWSDLCCQPLLWLDQPDPMKSVFDGMAFDPDQLMLGQFLAAWHEQFGEDAKMVRVAIERTRTGHAGAEEFADVLLDITGDRDNINARKLGKWINRHAGQVVTGFRIVKAPKTRNAENWRVESVTSVESVSEPSVAKTGTTVE